MHINQLGRILGNDVTVISDLCSQSYVFVLLPTANNQPFLSLWPVLILPGEDKHIQHLQTCLSLLRWTVAPVSFEI